MKSLKITVCTLLFLASLVLTSCGAFDDHRHRLVIDVRHQEMIVYADDAEIRKYPISTSKFGIGDSFGSCTTPAGRLKVTEKIGGGLPIGMVFKNRHPTGEILPPNARGRDPIVTRILWLKGQEAQNANAYSRFIYIHGTPEEKNIGRPSSFGCIRMRSHDVVELYDLIGVGAVVEVKAEGAPRPVARLVRGG